jgi:uncharacterized protein (TIGR02594 family)
MTGLRAALAAAGVVAALCSGAAAEAGGRTPVGSERPLARQVGRSIGHPEILAEARRWLGQGNPTPFREAWCRDFVNMILERAGYRLADRSHLAIAALRLGPRVAEPRLGDLAVMRSHVTFFAGWDGEGAFLGLGGNQRNRVRISRFTRSAVIAFVRPA